MTGPREHHRSKADSGAVGSPCSTSAALGLNPSSAAPLQCRNPGSGWSGVWHVPASALGKATNLRRRQSRAQGEGLSHPGVLPVGCPGSHPRKQEGKKISSKNHQLYYFRDKNEVIL